MFSLLSIDSVRRDEYGATVIGTVKWFNSAEKPYGFVTLDAEYGGFDVFVNFKAVEGGERTLEPGQRVSFTLYADGNKHHAENVIVVA